MLNILSEFAVVNVATANAEPALGTTARVDKVLSLVSLVAAFLI